jgi:hypothetical protein
MWLFVTGLLTGGISMFFTVNKAYRSEIWAAKQKIRMAQLRAEQEQIELEIENSITQRLRSASDYTFQN